MSYKFERKLCIYLLLLCNSFCLNARDSLDVRQEQELLVQLKNVTTDSERLSTYLELVQLVRYKNADKMIDYADRGLPLAIRLDDSRSEAQLLWLMGSGYTMKREIKEAIQSFEAAVDISRKFRDSTYAFALNGLGNTYEALGEAADAMVKYKQVIFLGDSLQEPFITTLGLGNLATLHKDIGNFTQAKQHLFKALNIAEQHELVTIKAYAYSDLADIYIEEEKYDSAQQYVQKSIILTTRRNSLPYIAASAYNTLAQVFFLQSRYKKSQLAVATALKIAEESGSVSGLADALLTKMKTHKILGEYETALNQGFQILELGKEAQLPDIELQVIEIMSDIYYIQKEYKSAYKHQKLLNQRKSENFKKKQLEHQELQELRVMLQKEKRTNQNLNLQLSEGNVRIENNKLFSLGMILFAFFLLMVVIVLYSQKFAKKSLRAAHLSDKHASHLNSFKKQMLTMIFILYPPVIIHLYIWASIEATIIHGSIFCMLIVFRGVFNNRINYPLYWFAICFYFSIALLPLYIGPVGTAFASIVAVFLNAFYLAENKLQRILNYILFPISYVSYSFLAEIQPQHLTKQPFEYELLVGLISICAIFIVVIYINKGIMDSRLALSKSNDFLRQITDLNPHFIFAKDSEGRFTLANKAMTQTLGSTHEELIGKNHAYLLKNATINGQSFEDDMAVLKTGKTIDRKEEIFIDSRGNEKYFQTIKKPIYNESWEITGMLGVSTDITDIKLAHKDRAERETTLNAIISSIPDPIFVIDSNMNPIILNQEFYEKTDIASIGYKESIIDYLKRTLPQELSDKYKKIIKQVLNGQHYSGFDIIKTPTGDVHYEMSGTPFRNKKNKIIGAILLWMNVTEKNKQRELIDQQIQDMNQKNNELEKYIQSNLSLENFAYLASHDLKAPLRTIISFSQLFERRVKKKINTEEKELLNFVIGASKNMEELINDLLEYSRVNTKKISITQFELKPLIKEILNELTHSVQEKKARFQLKELPETLLADEPKFRRLLQNLITNALKFSKHDKAARIMISAREEEDQWVFMIKDNGIGINDRYQQKIFLLFQRLHGDAEYSGTGIGLAMVKKIVEQHQGTVWVESEEGKGSKFYFSISKDL